MSGRPSHVEAARLAAKVADLKRELERQIRTLDALIAVLEDKGFASADELQEKAWQLHRRSLAVPRAVKTPMPKPLGDSVPSFLRGRAPAAGGPVIPPGRVGPGPPGNARPSLRREAAGSPPGTAQSNPTASHSVGRS